jgi:hypothetical protein
MCNGQREGTCVMVRGKGGGREGPGRVRRRSASVKPKNSIRDLKVATTIADDPERPTCKKQHEEEEGRWRRGARE